MFTEKVKTPSCCFEKNLNTPLSFTLKKVFAPLHSAPAPLYSKFFKPAKKDLLKLPGEDEKEDPNPSEPRRSSRDPIGRESIILPKHCTHICRIKGCGGAGWPPPTNNFRKT